MMRCLYHISWGRFKEKNRVLIRAEAAKSILKIFVYIRKLDAVFKIIIPRFNLKLGVKFILLHLTEVELFYYPTNNIYFDC